MAMPMMAPVESFSSTTTSRSGATAMGSYVDLPPFFVEMASPVYATPEPRQEQARAPPPSPASPLEGWGRACPAVRLEEVGAARLRTCLGRVMDVSRTCPTKS